jgi:hypothetical protein
LAGRGENLAARGQIFAGSPRHGGSKAQESTEIWTAQSDLQPGQPKPDRLIGQDAAAGEKAAPIAASQVSGLIPRQE